MVDSAINGLFVDLNSYFASIEQELCLELRGQPIAIVNLRVTGGAEHCTLWILVDDQSVSGLCCTSSFFFGG